jgi:3-phosphoshikimate 1-carboxyvinyltransferase
VRVSGTLRVPGDKSISHRALILGALGDGPSRLRGLLDAADVRATAAVLRGLGVPLPEVSEGEIVVRGVGRRGLRPPAADLDCGNSGTTARLMAGALAASPFISRLVGDASLSARPMRRVAQPLSAMGARFEFERGDGLPMTIRGGALQGLTWHGELASAQVKGAILLAGLVADVPVEVHEAVPTRDHTERMLHERGVDVRIEGHVVSLVPGGRLDAADVAVPADPSAAAFFVALAALAADGTLQLDDVLLNPSRTGAFRVLDRMGATIGFEDVRAEGGEQVGTLVARSRVLRGVMIGPDEVPSLIDELPMLACVAARAEGETRVSGAGELRVKESDRIAVTVANLRALGADADELPDGFAVRGGPGPLTGRVRTHGDHRIAMAFGVLGAMTGNAIEIDDHGCVDVSYPSFWSDLARVTS